MDQMRTCDICKEKSNTVEIRQSEDMRCDKCVENPSEKPRDRETSSNREDNEAAELRAVSLMYRSLLRKVKIKLKNSKGEQRVNVKWLGSLQELKDFVTVVLKKTGTWQETRRKASSTSFKTANLTITHYSSTQTLQFLGNKAKESVSYIKSLLDIINDGQDDIVDQTGPNQGDHTSETSEDSSISSLGSSVSFASHSTGLNDGFRTPDITGTQPSPDSDPCQDNVINYTHILERNLDELRSEQHRRWKEQKERDISFSKFENDQHGKINPDYYLMETLNHTNRLIANLDVSGLVNLLRHQIYKNEELHRKIEEKNDLIQSLQHKRQSLEESSKTDFKHVQNLRIAGSQSTVNSKSDTSERNIWTKPKTTVKNTFPPTWEPIQTENRFKLLFEPDKHLHLQEEASILTQSDDHVPVDIQQENVRLQRQVQYLQSRVASSAPINNLPDKSSSLENRSDIKDPNKKKPKLDTGQSVAIVGDSVVGCRDGGLRTNKKRIVKIGSRPGAVGEDLVDCCGPVAGGAPDVIILHVGTNDLDKRDEDSIVENIKKIKNEIVSVSPKTKVLVSLIIGRYDDGNLNDKGVLVNDKLMRELPRSDIIDNNNLDRQCVGLKGLHLNRLGNKHLALNFKQVLNGL